MANDKQTKKPSKQDLLDELESIKASLLEDNEENEDIPILDDLVIDDESCADTIAEIMEKMVQPQLHTNQDGNKTNPAASSPASSMPANTIPKQASGSQPSTNTPPITHKKSANTYENMAVLPGQQSLFDNDDVKPYSSATVSENIAHPKADKSLPKSSLSSTTNHSPKHATERKNTSPENPFLPPHIRERLKQNRKDAEHFFESFDMNDPKSPFALMPSLTSQQKLIAEQVASAISVFLKSIASSDKTDIYPVNNEDTTTANIDRLVTLYLPIIETELRQQLAEQITAGRHSSDSKA